jgi:hypothetical protein
MGIILDILFDIIIGSYLFIIHVYFEIISTVTDIILGILF